MKKDHSLSKLSSTLGKFPVDERGPFVPTQAPVAWAWALPILVLSILWVVSVAWGFWALEFYWHAHGRFPAWDPDTVLYRRWLEQSIDRQAPIGTDTYQCFPDVYQLQFPPFYLRLLLFTVWTYFSFFPWSMVDPEFVVGFLPVLAMLFLNALFFWRFWRTTRNIAFCALLAVASLPGFPQNITYTFLGIDHHWLETFCLWVTLLAAAEFHDSKRSEWKIVGGLMTAIFIGTWMGSPMWHALWTVYITGLWLAGMWQRFDSLAEFAGSAMTIGGGLVLMYLAFHPPGGKNWVVYQFSWMQPFLASVAGLWCLGLKNWGPREPWKRVLCIGLLAAGSFVVLFLGPSFSPFEEAKNFIFRKNYLVDTIGEMRPLVGDEGLKGFPKDWSRLSLMFGWPIILFPLFFFPDGRAVYRHGNGILRDFLLIFLGLTLVQARYGRWLAAGVGMLGGTVLFQLVRLVRRGLDHNPRLSWYVAGLIGPMLLVQVSLQLRNNWTQFDRPPDFLEALNWMQTKTPITSGYSDDAQLPEYGVLSFWDKGNYIPFLGRRPAVVANSGLGYRLQAKLLTAESESEAYELFHRHRIRYFLVAQDAMEPADHDYMNLLKRQPWNGALVDMAATVIPASISWRPYHEGFDAWVRHGMTFIPAGAFTGSPNHFRWVYLSKNRSKALPVVRILEAVPGACLVGHGDPGSPFEVRLPMRFDQFEVAYIATGTIDSTGRFEWTVPYSTSHVGGRIQTREKYRVRFYHGSQQCESFVEVPEAAVQEGWSIKIPTPRATSWGFSELK